MRFHNNRNTSESFQIDATGTWIGGKWIVSLSTARSILDEIGIIPVQTRQRHIKRLTFFCISLKMQIISSTGDQTDDLHIVSYIVLCHYHKQKSWWRSCTAYVTTNLLTALHTVNCFLKNWISNSFIYKKSSISSLAYKPKANSIK